MLGHAAIVAGVRRPPCRRDRVSLLLELGLD
jgi:hypothetical protein